MVGIYPAGTSSFEAAGAGGSGIHEVGTERDLNVAGHPS